MSSVRKTMDINEIMEVLPHRPPFLLVDRILDLNPGVMAVGLKSVSMNEPFFQGHFPGHPVMPAVLITEAMAQVGGVLLLSLSGNEGKIAYFAGIDKVRFRKPIGPGDLLVTRVEMTMAKGQFGKVHATGYVFRLESSALETPVRDPTFSMLPHNGIALLDVEGEAQRDRALLFGSMEGELAAEGDLMFALVERSPDHSG
ncbi:MAG TPA: 3-hydroxyacyl-ACP dehydratase FabZ [Armatimonadota bacterium]|nr:3-hydroxyacyl-ACP dehydratase FabZ [Armatimonadota bacterium]